MKKKAAKASEISVRGLIFGDLSRKFLYKIFIPVCSIQRPTCTLSEFLSWYLNILDFFFSYVH